VLKAATGDTVVEFTKEQGNFTYPRGKFALQVFPLPLTCAVP
jgi:hypothetical protein